ncbi:MAG TPA: Rrf2 family transcriptional regulator [Terracidiphilus sp.]|jgi:Rrf2 family protein|nr:Rrf2 family transcriptional regulator [Terracidiphilus sp.]
MAAPKTNSSMQLTRAADYAVRVMVFLAEQQPNARVCLAELARGTGAPESFLSKVMQALARGALITSQRGHAGGFSIAPRGLAASVREVIEAVDGPIRLNVCLGSNTACARQSWCPAHPVWSRAQEAMLKVLDGARVADLGECNTIPEMAAAAGFLQQRRSDPR